MPIMKAISPTSRKGSNKQQPAVDHTQPKNNKLSTELRDLIIEGLQDIESGLAEESGWPPYCLYAHYAAIIFGNIEEFASKYANKCVESGEYLVFRPDYCCYVLTRQVTRLVVEQSLVELSKEDKLKDLHRKIHGAKLLKNKEKDAPYKDRFNWTIFHDACLMLAREIAKPGNFDQVENTKLLATLEELMPELHVPHS
jgi:hypothetical protein